MRKFKEFGSGFGGRVARCIEVIHRHGGVAEAAEFDSKNPQPAAPLR
jgi:hypothetical protein